MSAITGAKRHDQRGAVAGMGIGLLLTVAMLVALIVDQASGHGMADQVRAHYSPFNLHPDPAVLYGYLYVTGATGVLLWLATIRGVMKHKRWARVVTSLVLVCATGFALLVMFASEYGGRVVPAGWGVLGLLPCVAGLVAVILLWNPGRAGRTRS